MKKPDFVSASFLYKLENYKKRDKLFCRNTSLVPKALHKNFLVYNGSIFMNVIISEEIIGHKLGEFCQSRRRYYFKKKKQKKK